MEVILVLLIVAVLNGAIVYIDEMLQELVPMTLYADQYMLAANGGSMVDVLFDIMLGFGISLIILKFLKKGFECYVMWTDGDPDSEPVGLVVRFMQAMAVELEEALKVVKLLYIEDYQKEDSTIAFMQTIM